MSRFSRNIFIALLLFIMTATFLHRPILTASGQYLKLSCDILPEQQVDTIIVLGGEVYGERTRKAVELYQRGIAPKLILSDGTQMSWRTKAIDEMVALAEAAGVPQRAILKESKSRSTYENAIYTKEVMIEQRFGSAVMVSSDWHMRRAQFIFDKVFNASGIQLYYCGTPDFQSDITQWWVDGEKQQTVLSEWARLVVYWMRYGLI